MLRPPLARKRLHRRTVGLLVLTLRKPYANGTTDFIFSEVELAQKLVALVPLQPKEQRVVPRDNCPEAPTLEPGDSRAARNRTERTPVQDAREGYVPMACLGRFALAGL